MPRPQFTLRALLVAMLVVGAFFAGVALERERQRRQVKPYNVGNEIQWTF
ncbi:MAG TPA: hypothetical protein VG826_23805 [Pirellulales bacterium]|nr:hypothetical protein [Pirellulales bacterium]